MDDKWRPEGWKNPHNLEYRPGRNSAVDVVEGKAYEAGADAMLKAIKEEYALQLFALDYNGMPVIVKDNQQVLIGIKLEEGELPIYLSAFTFGGDYVLRNLIISGEPMKEGN